MPTHHPESGHSPPPEIRNRTDCGGAWSVAWPLLALALIGLMLVRSCLPG